MADSCPFTDCRHYRVGYAQLNPFCQACGRRVHCEACGAPLDATGTCPNDCAACNMCHRRSAERCPDGACRACHVSLTFDDCCSGAWVRRVRAEAGLYDDPGPDVLRSHVVHHVGGWIIEGNITREQAEALADAFNRQRNGHG